MKLKKKKKRIFTCKTKKKEEKIWNNYWAQCFILYSTCYKVWNPITRRKRNEKIFINIALKIVFYIAKEEKIERNGKKKMRW